MTRSEWSRKTPYANSEAQNPDGAIQALLAKYGVVQTQWTTGIGLQGRPAIELRFVLKGKGYRMALETLEAEVPPASLLLQVKRALFYYLKSVLEVSTLFFSSEELLFAFLELPGGRTMFESAEPHLAKLHTPNFGQLMIGKD